MTTAPDETGRAAAPSYSEIEHASPELAKALHSLTEDDERKAVHSIQRLFRSAAAPDLLPNERAELKELVEAGVHEWDKERASHVADVARLTAERDAARELADKRWQDRFDALNVRSRDGLLASEWVLRTGKAERERAAARAEVEVLVERLDALHRQEPIDAMDADTLRIAREAAEAEAARLTKDLAEALEGRGRFAQSHAFIGGFRYVRWLDLHRHFFPEPHEVRGAARPSLRREVDMTLEAKIAYVHAQSAAMLAELEGMKQANREREARGEAPAYGEDAFCNLPARFGLSHNQVLAYLRE